MQSTNFSRTLLAGLFVMAQSRGGVALRRALDKLEKVSQVFAFRGLEFGKLDAHAEGRTALGDNPGQDEPFYPDLSVSQPKTDFDAYAGRHGGGGLDEAPPNAGIG